MDIVFFFVLFCLNLFYIIKLRLSKSLAGIFLVPFVLISFYFLFYVVVDSSKFFFDDGEFYYSFIDTNLSDLFDLTSLTLRIPAWSYIIFINFISSFTSANIWILSYSTLSFYWFSVLLLSQSPLPFQLPKLLYLSLFFSPTIIWTSLPLTKDTFATACLILFIAFHFKRSYLWSLFFLLIGSFARIYLPFAALSLVSLFVLFSFRSDSLKVQIHRFILIIISLGIFFYYRNLLQAYQFFVSWFALFFTPSPFELSSYSFSSLVIVQLVEVSVFIFMFLLLFGRVTLKLISLRVPFLLINFIDIALCLLPLLVLFSAEASQRVGDFATIGEQYNRKRSLLIPQLYISFWLAFKFYSPFLKK